MGKLLGVKKSAIQKYEAGKTTDLKASKIRILCQTFRVSPWTFLYEKKDDFWSAFFNMESIPKGKYQEDDLNTFLLNSIKEKQGEDALKIAVAVLELNTAGKKRVIQYIDDLSKIDEYRLTPK